MFARAPDASKIAMVTLMGHLCQWGFHFVDCQVYTDHLSRFGARELPRAKFLQGLSRALSQPTLHGPWQFELKPTAALDVLDDQASAADQPK
jgi:leucyl/phenylalanyl-tRNA--protein transferase